MVYSVVRLIGLVRWVLKFVVVLVCWLVVCV